ncbi:MAG: Holliday junction branch migration protein RuvA [Gammaproteobacteria bacterium]|nr:Holliday junction branch migration protein RuvA [Gammaproteobacteria bacterium]NIR97814.1 Holliday junction branch migration protein RuvA [Gammaproteobacteria bacterium]NIT63514.1 Holliday junction branch migration protein RuvA [Gammaproteobacteria bacterium]NIV20461.1 Holliday junction branch migration protein RuvA [Gammaproteobacteria bacterium]NIX11043.1 Holliday junction branch migration protein RuvA [Gammaproteobacteria bacterium]
MIGRLRGILAEKRAPQLLVDVQGVGYEVDAPMSTFYVLPEVGSEVTLHTHLVVREDSHALYGFATESERLLFRNLIRVSGVGAKLALTILSGITPEGFMGCVQHQDAAALVKLPGVGKKTAERLVMEMRDRLDDWQAAAAPVTGAAASGLVEGETTPLEDAVSALIALGYKPQEASRMVRGVEGGAKLSSEEVIRLALQHTVK